MKELLRRVDPADLVVEVFSIVLAILLALAVNQWQDQRKTQAEVRQSLSNIANEMRSNRRMLEELMPHHQHILAGLTRDFSSAAPVSASAFFSKIGPILERRGIGVFSPEAFAWNVATSQPSVNAIPYDLRVSLERVYDQQRWCEDIARRLGDDFHIGVTDLSPNFYSVTLDLSEDAGDLIINEHELDILYATMLKKLAAVDGST